VRDVLAGSAVVKHLGTLRMSRTEFNRGWSKINCPARYDCVSITVRVRRWHSSPLVC
jgi:hypothetical protein